MRDLIGKAGLGTPWPHQGVHPRRGPPAHTGGIGCPAQDPRGAPSHVVFVLATTDPHKVLPTIKSRTQHYELHLIPAAELEEHVRWVIKDAGLDVTEEQLTPRPAGRRRLGPPRCRPRPGGRSGGVDDRIAPADDLLTALLDRDPGAVLASVHAAVSAGRDRVLGEALVSRLRDAFLASVGVPLDHLPEVDQARTAELTQRIDRPFLTRSLDVIGTALVEMRQAADPRITLETALVRLADVTADTSTAALLERIDRLERQLAGGEPRRALPSPLPVAADPAEAPPPGPAPAPPPVLTPPAAPARETGAAAEARRKLAERAATRPAARPEPTPPHPPAVAPRRRLPPRRQRRSTPGPSRPCGARSSPGSRDRRGPASPRLPASSRSPTAPPWSPSPTNPTASGARRSAPTWRPRCRPRSAAPSRCASWSTKAAPAGRRRRRTPRRPRPTTRRSTSTPSSTPRPLSVKRGADRLVEAFPGAELIEDDQ